MWQPKRATRAEDEWETCRGSLEREIVRMQRKILYHSNNTTTAYKRKWLISIML